MVEQVKHIDNETVGVRVTAGSRNFSDFKVRRGYTVDNDCKKFSSLPPKLVMALSPHNLRSKKIEDDRGSRERTRP